MRALALLARLFFALAPTLMLLLASSGSAQAADLGRPVGSWERWIQGIRSGGRGGLPGRPDGKSFDAELPIWVDCHLSWYLDRPTKNPAEKSKFTSQLVLRSEAKLCKGQLEQWAH